MSKTGLSEKVPFEQRFEGGKRVGHAVIFGRMFLAKEKISAKAGRYKHLCNFQGTVKSQCLRAEGREIKE